MSVEISNIQNEVLRHAAEVADLNDNTANSGKLDQKELSVFIREAVKSDCNMDDIRAVCDQVGVEHATDDVKASMEKLNQLQKLEKELEYQNDILKKREDEIESLEKENNKNKWIYGGSTIAGVAAGGFGGFKLGAAIGGFFGPTGAVVGAVIGGVAGAITGMNLGARLANTYAPSNYNTREAYEEQARPIEEKVNTLKAQMKEIENEL